MKISYKHLSRHLINEVSIETISDMLFQLGHENEVQGNILDIEFTPNRGDCLSILGLARDLNALTPSHQELEIFNGELNPLKLGFTNIATNACNKISFLYLEVDHINNNYEDYLENYFSDLNINKNNLFTDVSNYVSYELGQPSHAYDFEKIVGEIKLKFLEDNIEFQTLLGKKINLQKGDLIFADDNEVINLAGLMGSQGTSCSQETKKVLIEFAFFQPDSLMGKSVKYDLNSDAAYKFERYVDPNLQEKSIRRFIQIISNHADISDMKMFSETFLESPRRVIKLDAGKINQILGTNISNQEIKEYLGKLSLGIVDESIEIPSFRNDLETENDIAEEIARVVGYDNIIPSKLKINENYIGSHNLEKYVSDFLRKKGLNEVINSQFNGINEKNCIVVDNPLDSNRKYIRTNLKDSLLENLTFNEKRQKDSIKLFEISDIYLSDGSGQIEKKKMLGIIASGRIGHNRRDFSKKINKNFIQNIFCDFDEKFVDEILKIARHNVDSKSKDEIFYLEVELSRLAPYFKDYELSNETNKFVKYSDISEFPSSTRDLSVLVGRIEDIEKVSKIIDDYNASILVDRFLFDFYENKEKNQIKVAYRLIFQSKENTLSDKDVDKEMNKMVLKIIEIKNASVPGFKIDG